MQDVVVPFQKRLLDSEVYPVSAKNGKFLRHEFQVICISMPQGYGVLLLSCMEIL